VRNTVFALLVFGLSLSSPAGDWRSGSFLIRLSHPLVDRNTDGSFALRTGSADLDALIERAGVHRIELALTAAAGSPRYPDAFRRYGLDRTYRFHVSLDSDLPDLITRFERLAGVDYAEPDYVDSEESVAPDDLRFTDQWNFDNTGQDPPGGSPDADIDGPEAWSIATGDGAVIAIVDSGLDFVHEDLAGREWVNSGEIPGNAIDDDDNGHVDDVHGWDFVNDDADPTDDRGHGTRVSSVAAAATNNALGMAGACWDCRIMSLKVIDSGGSSSTAWFADAVVYATDAGARVINYSAGNSTPSATRLGAINYAYDAGVVLVGGAGNAGIATNMSGVVYPKARAEFIASGGTDSLDRRARPYECSGSGSGSRYGKEVDVVTPASLILGATMGGGYGYVCGNSFGGPQLAGLIGLIHQLDPSAGREEVRHLIRSGAEDEVGRPTEDIPGFDIYHGWGRTNMHRTLQAVESSISLHVEGKSATRVSLATSNPLASSYDFVRGDLSALGESARGVDVGSVVCLEDDSPDPDTLGDEDAATPATGEGFFYLARFNAAPGAGSYGGSSRNSDRQVFPAPAENWTAEGDQLGARFGSSVGTAGDVNNDGFDDVIVGAELWDGDQVDEGAAFVYLGSASGLAATPASTLEGDQTLSSFGWSAASAGDVNGDGRDDVIVGAPLHDNGETDEGRAYVYYGTASGVSPAPDWTGEGDQAGAQFGFRVRTAGDVNGDGFADVIVGAPLYDGSSGTPDTRPDRGRAFVYHGSVSGLSPYGSPDWIGEPGQANAWYGRGVGTAGSVNCDAYDDVIVGAPRQDNGEPDEGLLYVYYGSATGLSNSPDNVLEIDAPDARLGYAAFAAGDVNGDGCGDIIAGAYNFGNGDESEGAVYVWLGSSAGLGGAPDWSFEADERFAELGIAAETAGNVNGDAYDDVIIGAHLLDAIRSDEGHAIVFHGSASGLPENPDWTAAGRSPAAQLGWRVAGAGDVNGDGFDDAVVGDRFYQNGETDEGRATVYHGSLTGLSKPAATSDCAR
jgi:hypothetical protein